MRDENCIFCMKYGDKGSIIHETKHFYCQWDPVPVSPGHAEVIPIRHVASLFDLTEKEWKELKKATKDMKEIIENADFTGLYEMMRDDPVIPKSEWFAEQMLKHPSLEKNPDGYNIGVNEGEAAGRTIHHLHIHIIPRYSGDVEDPRGGVRYIIPHLANYKTLGQGKRHSFIKNFFRR